MLALGRIISGTVRVSTAQLAREFERRCREPRRTQERLLKTILRENAHTAYGRRWGFERIDHVRQYQATVPPADYRALEPFIERMLRGEPRQLTAEPPVFYATTSGTTGSPKFIPLTEAARRLKAAAARLWLYYVLREHPDAFDGVVLSVVSPEEEGRTPAGVPFGSESGHLYRNIPAIVRSRYAVPYEVFTLRDYEAKYYAVLRACVGEDVSMIATANPSTVVVLSQRMAEHQEQLLRDLHDGTLDARFEIPRPVREAVEARLRPQPDRARTLEHIIGGGDGRMTPAVCWPRLRVVACWRCGSSVMYVNQLQRSLRPGVPIRDWGYLASEVRGSIPMTDGSSGGVLSIGSNVFEFVREDEIERPNPAFLSVDEVEVGARYYVFFTTTSGLYRYDINDVVEVVGHFERTPIIEFVQKGRGVVSVAGEKVSEAQVVEAVRRARDSSGLDFEFVAASVEWQERPRYIFLTEFPRQPPREDVARLGRAIEENLWTLNGEYEAKRHSLRLDAPIVKVLVPGETERYRREKIAGGRRDSQFKMLYLNGDTSFQQRFRIAEQVPASLRV